LYERVRHAAPGLCGGQSGAPGRLSASGGVDLQPKLSRLVPPSTIVTLELPGGGGFGTPLARDPAAVLHDVREGYVSIDRARDDYGVVIDPASMSVREAETAQRRAERRAATATP
jgi:N-methylhydantoinase B